MREKIRLFVTKIIRRMLAGVGIDPSFVTQVVNTVTPSIVYRELHYRVRGSRHPIPPPRLIWTVIGTPWASDYVEGGEAGAKEILELLSENGIDMDRFDTLLDFGCGCGRIIRHLVDLKVDLYGTDSNPQLIRWCRKKLGFAEFDTNNPFPPLEYIDESFNFVFAGSVFTHIGEELQEAWITEMRRILKTGGYLWFTTHGEQRIHVLTKQQQEQFRRGNLVAVGNGHEGSNACASFQSRKFVEERLLKGFELVEFAPGGTRGFGAQDIYILRKT